MKEERKRVDFRERDHEKAPERWRAGSRVGVIGGLGEMGKLFTRFFQDRGYEVEIADLNTEKSNEEVARSSDMVVFAVPLHETTNIIRSLIPYVRPEQLLMDLTSLKTDPIREMLRSPASVVGLHPMFGGRISFFEGQTLVACPVRIDPANWAYLRNLFLGSGIRVKETTPEKHDRMMSIIQVLFHMTTMLTGRVLRELDTDIAETLEYTSPSYRLEMSMLGRIFAQNGALYSAITQMNPHTPEIIAHLNQGLQCYEQWYQNKDLDAFIRDFEQSAQNLGSFSRRAYRESSAILDFTVKWANENDNGRGEES